MKRILFTLLAVYFAQAVADTPEEWIARANKAIKTELRASSNTRHSK